MRARRSLVGLIASVALILPSAGHSALPPVGWIPDQLGLPFIAATAGDGKPVPVYTSRRIVADPTVKGRFLLGNAIFGLYESVPGVGWTTLTPYCLPRVSVNPATDDLVYGTTDAAFDLLGALGGCGVEGIAFDPQDPLAVYVSAYNLTLNLSNLNSPKVEYGGVYKAELRVQTATPPVNQGVSTGGITWRRILPGIRGNAIAVDHPPVVRSRSQPVASSRRIVSSAPTQTARAQACTFRATAARRGRRTRSQTRAAQASSCRRVSSATSRSTRAAPMCCTPGQTRAFGPA
ncbi:MAG: hypothetical protein LC750_00775 [Actinobacteria bacterium]|nr:hypothetical protein [Actinomycetota bacterium]